MGTYDEMDASDPEASQDACDPIYDFCRMFEWTPSDSEAALDAYLAEFNTYNAALDTAGTCQEVE